MSLENIIVCEYCGKKCYEDDIICRRCYTDLEDTIVELENKIAELKDKLNEM